MFQQLLLCRGHRCCCYVMLQAVMELWSKCVTWIITDKRNRNPIIFFMMHFLRDIFLVCVESEAPEGHFCVTVRVPTIGQLRTRNRESGSISTKIFHISPIPPCGFAGDSDDPALFWKTRSYQGRRRFVGGLRGSSTERRVIFNSCAVQLFNSHNKKC